MRGASARNEPGHETETLRKDGQTVRRPTGAAYQRKPLRFVVMRNQRKSVRIRAVAKYECSSRQLKSIYQDECIGQAASLPLPRYLGEVLDEP